MTPLHVLARHPKSAYDTALAPVFIKLAADLMVATNLADKTAMHVAIEHRNYPVLEAMREHSKDLDQVLRIKEFKGSNCVHAAITD